MKSTNKWLMPVFVTLITILVFYSALKKIGENTKPTPKRTYASLGLFSSGTTADGNTINAPQRVHPIRISGDVSFVGESVPLKDQEVRERFDRELLVNTFWHSNTLLNYKLANKYFSIIDEILKENNVPLDFKYLAVAESGLRDVVSPAGAAGFWQFLESTGKHYGLEINSEVDERYHLEKATKAACDYLKEGKGKFGSWTLAAASYNVGMGKLEKRLGEQKVENYYDLYLNSETSRYIFRILSYKMVFENPDKFGFHLRKSDLYEPFKTKDVLIESSIADLAQFAQDNNTNYKMLKLANPWLRSDKLTVRDGKSYIIKIPYDYVDEDFDGMELPNIILDEEVTE
ncbi:MAG: lytic transglycosylase domain-containing protein [Chitinophagales bacterium]